jgi:hypothetical protein
MIRIRIRQSIRLNGDDIPAGVELDAQDLLAIELLLRGAASALDKAAALERICELLDAADSANAAPSSVDFTPLQAHVH